MIQGKLGTFAASRKWLVAGAVALAALVLYLIVAATRADGTPPAPRGDAPPLVTVASPGLAPVATRVVVTGTIRAQNDLPLGIDGESGRIAAVNADVGDRVKRGQVLARLDTSVLEPQVAQLEASLARAEAEAALAAADWRRAQGVEAAGALSVADIEQRRSELDTANAQARMVEAQLAEMRARLERTRLRAPADGVVLTRDAEVGQIVSPGSDPLFRLAQDGEIELRGRVAEQDLPSLSVGQPASVRITGVAEPFEGTVRLLGAVIDPETRLGEVRIALGSALNLRPGAFARGEILVGDARRPVVAQTAVLSDTRGTYVYVVGADHRVERRAVRVDATIDGGLVIGEGLTGDEQIVTTAGAFLREGEEIRVAIAEAG